MRRPPALTLQAAFQQQSPPLPPATRCPLSLRPFCRCHEGACRVQGFGGVQGLGFRDMWCFICIALFEFVLVFTFAQLLASLSSHLPMPSFIAFCPGSSSSSSSNSSSSYAIFTPEPPPPNSKERKISSDGASCLRGSSRKPSHRVAGYSISLWVALPPPPLTLEAQGTVTRLASLCLPQRSGGGDGASLTSLMEIFSCPIHNTWAVGVRVRKGALSPIRPQFDHSCDACMRTIA